MSNVGHPMGDMGGMGGDHPAVHGMLIVGEGKILLSHLPMFHSPHDYQVLLEVGLSEQNADPAVTYRRDRETSGEPIYTWVPAPFVLPTLFGAPGALMRGSVFRGHFERGGVAITSNQVRAEVTRVLYAHQFSAAEQPPANLGYLLFGSPAEPFLAHLITRAPDFDHVVSVDLHQTPPGWDGTALPVEFPARRNVATERLRLGDDLEALVAVPGGASMHVTVRNELYFETGDLES